MTPPTKKHRRNAVVGVLGTWVLAAACATHEPTRAARPLDHGGIDRLITENLASDRLVGLSVALVRDGRIEHAKGYGVASLATRAPVETTTLFAIGSITKQFVAASILLLGEEGRLSVDDQVAKYYPMLTRAQDITLLDLIHHVSGYPDYYPLDFVDERLAALTTQEQVVLDYGTKPLDFEPGTRWSYSNTGYVLLGRIVERVAGVSMGAFLEERLFRPAGMEHTRYEPAAGSPSLATGYTRFALESPAPAVPEGAGWIGAAGGIWSTATDLALWDLALLNGTVLSERSRATLFTVRHLADGSSTHYAGGLGVKQVGGRTLIQHGGAVAGFAARNTLVPEHRAAVVILSNFERSLDPQPLLDLVSPPIDDPARPEDGKSTRPPPPDVQGPSALQAALDFYGELRHGEPDRARLGADYSRFLDPARVARSARELSGLGDPIGATLVTSAERGGMEVAELELRFPTRSLSVLMYRTPDGRIQEFLLW